MQKAYLILENGTIFEGKSFGAAGEAIGEIVFTTAMTGYLETLTDPSYYGQIVVQTFPLIGNYGVIPEDFESECPHVKAYIVRDWCQEPSNFRCEGDLDTFLKQHNIVGLYGIDTRQLTKIVRESGVMNGKIVPEGSSFGLTDLKNYTIVEAVKNTTCSEEKTFEPEGEVKRKVVLYDFGAKHNIGRELVKRGCEVTVVPAYTKAERIKELAPDGIMLSNGPGDPAENVEIIEELKKLSEMKIPTFGICLGHQLFALHIKCPPGRRQLHTPLFPDKQREPDVLLQQLDLLADSGLGNAMLLGGFCKIQMFCGGKKYRQSLDTH